MDYKKKYLKYKTKYLKMIKKNRELNRDTESKIIHPYHKLDEIDDPELVEDELTFVKYLDYLSKEDKSKWENNTLDNFLRAFVGAYEDHMLSNTMVYQIMTNYNNPWSTIAKMLELAIEYE